MFRTILSIAAVALILGITLVPDPADARRGGGGGYRGGGGRAVAAGRMHGGVGRYAHVSRPIAGRPGARAAYRAGAYRGARYGAYRGARYGAYRGYGYGAAAVGAAAIGAAGAAYYRGGCGYDAYGNWVCPGYPGYRY
jgi:hypothetical protein